MTPQERFKKAVLRGMKASPFAGTVVMIYGSTRHTCTGCQVASGDNKAKADEYGLTHVRTLEVRVPKAQISRRPVVALDAVEYQGRKYTIDSVEGDDACSPLWAISASAPL